MFVFAMTQTSQTPADASANIVNHTPGPWSFTEAGVHADTLNAHGNFYICALPFPSEEPSEQEAANLRLIAAAPDMLEALKLAVIAAKPGATCEQIRAASNARHAAIANTEGAR